MPTLVAHLDADCFYVSAERVRHSFLRGQPVGVLGNQGACVIAKSYELKAKGVKTGMPIWDAVPLCPEAIFIKRDFEWYEVLSRQMLELLRQESPTVEYYSIDEMFFDARGLDPGGLQQRFWRELGLPVTVGVSTTRSLAKLASDNAKPFGCHIAVTPEAIAALLYNRPVDEITGIALRSAHKLGLHGIRTCDQFVRADRRLIRRLLTATGEKLWWELNGEPVQPIQSKRVPHKVLARGGSVGKATDDPARCEAWTVRNLERLIEALDYYQVYCEQLAMEAQFQDGKMAASRTSLPYASADFATFYPAALHLLKHCWRGQVLSYMHLFAERLCPREGIQRGLFDSPRVQDERIAEAKRQANEKLGRFLVRSGATLPLNEIYHDEASNYDICDVYGKSCF